MDVGKNGQRRAWTSWLFIGALLALALTVGIIQYRWIGEVSRAERERLQSGLQTSLNRLSQEFNAELNSTTAALLPNRPIAADAEREQEYVSRYMQWRESTRHNRLLRSVSLAVPEGESVALMRLNADENVLRRIEWPEEWTAIRDRLNARLSGEGFRRQRLPGPITDDYPAVFDVPSFFAGPPEPPPRPRPGTHGAPPRRPNGMREIEWLLLELDLDYVRASVIPELLHRYLGGSGTVEYHAEIVMSEDPSHLIFRSNVGGQSSSIGTPDGSVRMFEPRLEMVLRRAGIFGRGGRGRGPDDNPVFDRGRWLLSVQHRDGSLEAVVDKSRWRSIAATTTLLVLMIITVAALLRYTRRAQNLAELQMQFVAGVSHELRTPLTVMRTAGHNLQGRVSNDPGRVQRYGALIEEESGKLTAIVEQVLRFANVNAGRVIGVREPISVPALIEEAVEADRRIIQESRCAVEKAIAPDLPDVLGDPTTLRHALQNLINNAAKYGKDGERITISAAVNGGNDHRMVEIRIEDCGPGIPDGEIGHIFDPFYRGKKAVEDQIHGTGLGLSLAKRIIEAHHGQIGVESQVGKGTQFVVRLPAMKNEPEYEFTNSAG
jgi:signal transduction histidine kinase